MHLFAILNVKCTEVIGFHDLIIPACLFTTDAKQAKVYLILHIGPMMVALPAVTKYPVEAG